SPVEPVMARCWAELALNLAAFVLPGILAALLLGFRRLGVHERLFVGLGLAFALNAALSAALFAAHLLHHASVVAVQLALALLLPAIAVARRREVGPRLRGLAPHPVTALVFVYLATLTVAAQGLIPFNPAPTTYWIFGSYLDSTTVSFPRQMSWGQI